jgi:hypothetical protein
LLEGHLQLAKAALTENKRVKFKHFVADGRGQRGPCGASGNARGSRTGTPRAGLRRGREGDTIALNDAKCEG